MLTCFPNTVKQQFLTKWFVSPEDMWWCLGTHITVETNTRPAVPREATTAYLLMSAKLRFGKPVVKQACVALLESSDFLYLGQEWHLFHTINTSPATFYSGFLEHFWASAHELPLSCMLENRYNSLFLGLLTLKSKEEPELCPSVSFTRILALFLWKGW